MRGKKIAGESKTEYSKSEWGEVFHHILVPEEALVEVLASCSFAAVAVVGVAAETVAEGQEWANFAVDRQTIPWRWGMGEDSSRRVVEEVRQ
jgi:hypothetical protein